jgi:hypothetical protein
MNQVPGLLICAWLVASCAQAQTSSDGANPRTAAAVGSQSLSISDAGMALTVAVEKVCKPFVLSEKPEKSQGLIAAEGVGFRRTSTEEILAGHGEDLLAVLPRDDRTNVTVTLWDEGGSCGVAVTGAPTVFDAYVDGLTTSGWQEYKPATYEHQTRNEYLRSPDGRLSIVAGRFFGAGVAPAARILALVVEAQRSPPDHK